ncbi:MAG TPA: hypothetical protein VN837_18240 [Chloroflexota bacterium]|nr:hypothetical protein [Chloroflexota bacterium]
MAKKQEQFPDIVETEFFISWDDPDSETVSVGFLERSLVMDFDYAEFLDFAAVVDEVRTYIKKARANGSPWQNGLTQHEH